MFRTTLRPGSGVLLACCFAACASPDGKDLKVAPEPRTDSVETKAPSSVHDSDVKHPPAAKAAEVNRSEDHPSTMSVSMMAWLYRTGHTGKIGRATFISSMAGPSAPSAATLSPTLQMQGDFAIPGVDLSNPSMHGMHIRDPIHVFPSDPPEDGTGPHGSWVGSNHRYGAAELADFDPQKDHFGDLKDVQVTYNTLTVPPQSQGTFYRNLSPAAKQGITFEDDILGEVIAIDGQSDATLPLRPMLYGSEFQIVAMLLVPHDFDTSRLAELTPDWRDDAGGPLASFLLRTVKKQRAGRAQFVLDADPKSHRPRLMLHVSIYADLDLSEGRHAMKLKRSDGTITPIPDKIGITVTPLSGGVSFSEARIEADLTDLFVADGSRTDFLVGSTLVIDGAERGDGDGKPLITGQVPPAR